MSNLKKGIHLLQLLHSQWKSLEELQKIQNKKLQAILKYSYETIPIYHKKFKQINLKPEDIKTFEDLVKLPFLTKDDIQTNYPTHIVAPSIDIATCWTPHTSGTTGNPLTTVYDEHAEDFEKACALRPNIACGQRPFDTWAVITSPGNIQHKTENKKWFQRLGVFNQTCVSLFDTTQQQINVLEKIQPDVLDGYSSALYILANELKTTDNKKIKPKILFGTSDLLTKKMRETINSAFQVEMYDQFGCVEMGRTAWECPHHSGYHIDMEAVIMEFIKDDEQVSAGERGEIVYTNLYNYSMPLIRFKIGDVGVPTDEKCPCGRGLPLMEILEGRKDNFIIAPNGQMFPPTIWIIILMYHDIKQFKVIQEKIDKIKILIVPKSSFTQASINDIKKKTNEVLGDDISIEIEIVDEIEREKSGKFKPIVSKVKGYW